MNIFKKLSDKEMEKLEGMLTRAIYNGQLSIGANVGNIVSDDGDTDVEGGLSSFHTVDEVIGSSGYDGECVGVSLSYDGLKWLWARVQGARGGKKKTLTSEQARAMAAKRHGR